MSAKLANEGNAIGSGRAKKKKKRKGKMKHCCYSLDAKPQDSSVSLLRLKHQPRRDERIPSWNEELLTEAMSSVGKLVR